MVNALQSWGAGAVDGTIAMADMVTPGSLPRIGNPNTDSIYGASYTIGEWDGPANLIGAGGAFKGARLVQGLTSRITAANKLAAGTKAADTLLSAGGGGGQAPHDHGLGSWCRIQVWYSDRRSVDHDQQVESGHEGLYVVKRLRHPLPGCV